MRQRQVAGSRDRCHGEPVSASPVSGGSSSAWRSLCSGAATLGYLMGLARSAVLDAELTERIDRQLDELREEQRRVQEEKWLSDGVSPIENSWRALAQRAGAADEDPAAAAVPANDIDRRLADLIRQRCDRVWRGIKEKRYWRQVDGKTVGPDLGAIGGEIEGVVREVAGLYHQDRDDPVMEARLGDIVLTSRSVLGELLQIARLVPVVDLPAQSLATRWLRPTAWLLTWRNIVRRPCSWNSGCIERFSA